MTAPYVLRHIHLPGITPFATASAIQDVLVRQFLDHKALTSSQYPPSPPPPAPTPTILTFSPNPVYTTGRRERGTLSTAQIDVLKATLPSLETPPYNAEVTKQNAEVHETLRGGQTTFHGPGQLVIYPILDLKAIKTKLWPKGLTAKCYVNLLEEATIRTIGGPHGIKGIRTDNPGVWIDEQTKIAALGVHLRRNIASYGVGLNVKTDLRWFDRIVACGLEGKRTTSMAHELGVDKSFLWWALKFTSLIWGPYPKLYSPRGAERATAIRELLEEAERQPVKQETDDE
jgi:lipoate-protein ligase B